MYSQALDTFPPKNNGIALRIRNKHSIIFSLLCLFSVALYTLWHFAKATPPADSSSSTANHQQLHPATPETHFKNSLDLDADYRIHFALYDLKSQRFEKLIAANEKIKAGHLKNLIRVSTIFDRLGTEYQFQTQVYLLGKYKEGTIFGDLIFLSSGDPTIKKQSIDQLMTQLRAFGIQKIQGHLHFVQHHYYSLTSDKKSNDPFIYNYNSVELAFFTKKNAIRCEEVDGLKIQTYPCLVSSTTRAFTAKNFIFEPPMKTPYWFSMVNIQKKSTPINLQQSLLLKNSHFQFEQAIKQALKKNQIKVSSYKIKRSSLDALPKNSKWLTSIVSKPLYLLSQDIFNKKHRKSPALEKAFDLKLLQYLISTENEAYEFADLTTNDSGIHDNTTFKTKKTLKPLITDVYLQNLAATNNNSAQFSSQQIVESLIYSYQKFEQRSEYTRALGQAENSPLLKALFSEHVLKDYRILMELADNEIHIAGYLFYRQQAKAFSFSISYKGPTNLSKKILLTKAEKTLELLKTEANLNHQISTSLKKSSPFHHLSP